MPDNIVFERLYKEMENRNLCVSRLAQKAGMLDDTLWARFRGKSKWTVHEMLIISQILELPSATCAEYFYLEIKQ